MRVTKAQISKNFHRKWNPNCAAYMKKTNKQKTLSIYYQLCATLCNPMDCSTPGLPVHHHQLPEFTQTHVHLSQWCHPTISSSVVPFSRHQRSPLCNIGDSWVISIFWKKVEEINQNSHYANRGDVIFITAFCHFSINIIFTINKKIGSKLQSIHTNYLTHSFS